MGTFVVALATAVGLAFGSFLNVVLSRVPRGESVVSPGSRCPSCRRPLAWWENVPVVSYLALGGRCRTCRASIGVRHLLVEAVAGAVAGAGAALALTRWPWLTAATAGAR